MIANLRLPFRLALPLFATAIAVTLAVTAGMILLVRSTVGVVQRQSGLQLSQIANNQLQLRAATLRDVVTVMRILDGELAVRNRAWDHAPIDAAVLFEAGSGRVLSALGPAVNAADLRAIGNQPAAGALIVRAGSGLVIGSAMAERRPGRLLLAGNRLDDRFAGELKSLLQGDVDVRVDGRRAASTVTASGPPENAYPVDWRLTTPAGAEVRITLYFPAEAVLGVRRRALLFAIGGGLAMLAAAFAFYGYAVVRVTRPIRDLTAAADRIAAGDLEARLPDGAPAELGTLVRQFNAMARSIKELQERLVHSAKLSAMGQLMAGASHELSNPLLGLLGNAEYLATKFAPGDPVREKLDLMIREATRMKRTLEDLRAFTRPNVKNRIRVDLNSLVEEALGLIVHDAEKAGVGRTTSLQPGGAAAFASSDQIRQVLLNLVLNSLQAMPEGGTLSVSTSWRDQDGRRIAVVRVEDTGRGIRPEDLARITEPFFSTTPGRMGLGLAISKDIVDQHGGRLSFRSMPGEGTCATLELPAEPPA
ncbi:MAG: ATP-binding protein [Candidatus Coatesbacteria bacterium]